MPESEQISSGQSRPPVWQLVRSAMTHFNREVSYSELKQFIWNQYPDVNEITLNCQISVCSVNSPSRVSYTQNKKPRIANGPYDFLFNTGKGRVAPYEPSIHGQWEIVATDDGRCAVRLAREPIDAPDATPQSDDDAAGTFALESHLRDYLARNLPGIADIGVKLSVFKSDDDRDGVEFQTDMGPIDILALSSNGDFFVFELKLGRGPDSALGQILRYMGWVQEHLAKGKKVFGVVIAATISDKLRYAATQVPNVRLMQYELRFNVKAVGLRTLQ